MINRNLYRRDFMKSVGLCAGAATLGSCSGASRQPKHGKVPSYLKDYAAVYEKNPRESAIEWFRDAKFGLFLHFGLYSLLKHGEWVQLRELIPVLEYEKLKNDFKAENFDADFITDLALEAEMKYINITTRHHDSFCLFDTKQTEFNSMNTPAGRDLVGELAEQCNKKGLGFFLYYSHGRDWRHPHAPNNGDWGGNARPKYPHTETYYKYGDEQDLDIYLDFMRAQITELLTNYGPIAGIWLDGIAVPRSGDVSKFKCQELYDYIHSLQPQVLVSYKQGMIFTEDFFAPERHGVVEQTQGRPLEICDTLQPRVWGYDERDQGKHVTADGVMTKLANAAYNKANLLLNTGPLSDGSIHKGDAATLREVGKRIRAKGFPPPQKPPEPKKKNK